MTEAERWLAFADEDLQMAALAMSQDIPRQACFHAQQAVEKALKGLLQTRIGTYPKSHVLEELLLYHPQTREELRSWRDACRELDAFYIPTRYPDALPGLLPGGDEPSEADAARAVQGARGIVADIRHCLGRRQ